MPSSYKVIKGGVISGLEMIITPSVNIVKENSIAEEQAEISETGKLQNAMYEEMQLIKQELLRKAETEAEAEAHSIINSAKALSEQLIQSSKDEGYQHGYQEGYKEGYSYGIKESKKESQKLYDEASQYIASCQEAVKNYIQDKEKNIIELSVEIARHIINTELTMNPDTIFSIARLAITKVVDKQQVIIKVCPQDLIFLKNKKEELSIFVDNPSDIIIVPDASLEQGCVTAETSSGYVDTDIENQLEAIKKLLIGE